MSEAEDVFLVKRTSVNVKITEILNNTRASSRLTFGTVAIGRQIQVPNARSLAMSKTKKNPFKMNFLICKWF